MRDWLKSKGINRPVIENFLMFPTNSTKINMLEDLWCEVFLGAKPAARYILQHQNTLKNNEIDTVAQCFISLQENEEDYVMTTLNKKTDTPKPSKIKTFFKP